MNLMELLHCYRSQSKKFKVGTEPSGGESLIVQRGNMHWEMLSPATFPCLGYKKHTLEFQSSMESTGNLTVQTL